MAGQWHYEQNGRTFGPISATDLKQLADSGQLQTTDRVWKEGFADWIEATQIKGLFPALIVDAPPVPIPSSAVQKSGDPELAKSTPQETVPAPDTNTNAPVTPPVPPSTLSAKSLDNGLILGLVVAAVAHVWGLTFLRIYVFGFNRLLLLGAIVVAGYYGLLHRWWHYGQKLFVKLKSSSAQVKSTQAKSEAVQSLNAFVADSSAGTVLPGLSGRSTEPSTPKPTVPTPSLNSAEWVGMKFAAGRYTVTEKFGEGGMGAVYRVWDENLQTEVVLKVPKRSMLDDPEFAGRFQREIRSLVKLSHPNIVKIQDVGEFEGMPFCVMQFLSGGDLKGRCVRAEDSQRQPMPIASLKTWLLGVADALDFIHKQNFVHRDVKPANILFDAHENAYLSDFGVAKVIAENAATEASLTGTGMVLGTPEYMAPEMVLGEPFDGRADQYALAATVYEVLAGCLPLTGPTASAILVKQTAEIPKPLCDVVANIPRALSDAVMRALAKKPEERFPDCRSFAQAALAGATEAATVSGSGANTSVESSVAGFLSQMMSDSAGTQSNSAASQKTTPAIVSAPAANQRRRTRWLVSATAVVAVGCLLWWTRESTGEFLETTLWATTPPVPVELTPEEEEEARPLADHLQKYDFKNSVDLKMVCIGPGKFLGPDAEEWVEFGEPFWIAEHEVTVSQYLFYVDSNFAYNKRDPEYPAWLHAESVRDSILSESSEYGALKEQIRHNAAPIVGLSILQMEGFCNWLSQVGGERLKYSLPSPEQWACAYRAKSLTSFYWGDQLDKDRANLGGDSDRFEKLANVKSFDPNPFGLYDMAGNVWEATDDFGTVMGGGWETEDPGDSRPMLTSRKRTPPSAPSPSVGFRVVGTLKPPAPPATSKLTAAKPTAAKPPAPKPKPKVIRTYHRVKK